MTTISKRIFHLSCHCQSNILRITFPSSVQPFAKNEVCDCSFCLKRRIIWTVVPGGTAKVLKGMDNLKTYQFGNKELYHQSCEECGSYLLGTFGSPQIDLNKDSYLNLRCIRDDDFDLWKYAVKPMYYSKEGSPYTHVTLSDIPGAKEYLDEHAKSDHPTEVLVGSCHCKAVKFAVAAEKLGTGKMNDCACSICSGNGSLWIYPWRQNVFFSPSAPGKPYHPLDSAIFTYGYYKKENLMWHCKICSCTLFEAEPEEVLDQKPLEKQKIGLNIALLWNIEDYFDDVAGLSWKEEERIEGYNGYKPSEDSTEEEKKKETKMQRDYKKLESMRRGRGMKFAGPPHYKLDLEGLA